MSELRVASGEQPLQAGLQALRLLHELRGLLLTFVAALPVPAACLPVPAIPSPPVAAMPSWVSAPTLSLSGLQLPCLMFDVPTRVP